MKLTGLGYCGAMLILGGSFCTIAFFMSGLGMPDGPLGFTFAVPVFTRPYELPGLGMF